MEHDFEHIDTLIARCLAGEAGQEELARLEAWRSASPENNKYLEDSRRLMAMMDVPVNTDAAWKALDQRISESSGKIVPLYKKTSVLRIAAAVILLAGLGAVASLFLSEPAAKPMLYAATQQPVQQRLPDGSQVVINKHSELSFETGKDGSRQVKLSGEAYFEVVHDEKKPFVVNVSDIMIRDIGTAFNIKAIPGAERIEVTVESGEVQFYSTSDPGLTLKQGEKATYYIADKRFIKENADPVENTASYKTKLFRFKDTRLKDVFDQLNAVYGTNIRTTDETVANKRLSVVFDHEDPDMIISIIAETLDLEIEKTGTTTLLRQKQATN